jgi:hypothetical protein
MMLYRSVLHLLLIALVRMECPLVSEEAASPTPVNTLPSFSIEQREGRFSLLRPDKNRFFSLGICVVDQGVSQKDFDSNNPGYAAWKHYPDSNVWAKATLARLKPWGFTTVGGWSDFRALQRSPESEVVFAPVLHIGSTAGAPWWDMWDQKIIDRMDQIARDQILPLRNDPRLLGYYSDNEMGWWNGILFNMTLEQAESSGQRQRLIELLRTTYRNNWEELLIDFEPAPGVENWENLAAHGRLFLRPGGNGVRTERRFLALLAERYYSLVKQIIRKYDSRALILGDRYQSFYYPEVVRASAPYVDAISSNLNAGWNDGSVPRFYLETLHALTGKPIMVGEFYLAANENRSGNKNTRGTFPVVETQKERARGIRNTLQMLINTPYVIGADWFQYYDEPMHGRYDGENFNFGLVDIYNRPYDGVIKAFSDVQRTFKNRKSLARPDASGGVPSAPRDPTADFHPMRALRDWDRERGFVVPKSEMPMADLYLSWSKNSLFLGLYAHDVCEDAFYRDKIVRPTDRAEWIVSIGGIDAIRARVGAGLEPIINNASARITNTSGVNGNFRNIGCLELPASLFGKLRFKAEDEVELASTFFTHCRGYSTEWKGRFKLARK